MKQSILLIPILLATSGHAMAAGWYLITPPSRNGIVYTQVPLSLWDHSKAFDTAAECESYRVDLVDGATRKVYQETAARVRAKGNDGPLLSWEAFKGRLVATRCVPTDDPALNK
jgi:hypothetical protein